MQDSIFFFRSFAIRRSVRKTAGFLGILPPPRAVLSRSSYSSMMLKKSSAGTDAMNKVAQRALEAGLFMYSSSFKVSPQTLLVSFL